EHGDQHPTHRVRRRPVRDRHIEHHDQEAEGGPNGHEGDIPGLHHLADRPGRLEPDRDHGGSEHDLGLRAQISIGYVQGPASPWREPSVTAPGETLTKPGLYCKLDAVSPGPTRAARQEVRSLSRSCARFPPRFGA